VSLDLSHKALLPCYILPASVEWYWYVLSAEPEMFDEIASEVPTLDGGMLDPS
jgi:hypothetical protein